MNTEREIGTQDYRGRAKGQRDTTMRDRRRIGKWAKEGARHVDDTPPPLWVLQRRPRLRSGPGTPLEVGKPGGELEGDFGVAVCAPRTLA